MRMRERKKLMRWGEQRFRKKRKENNYQQRECWVNAVRNSSFKNLRNSQRKKLKKKQSKKFLNGSLFFLNLIIFAVIL